MQQRNAERALDLFHTLSANLPPAVDVAIEDVRRGRTWRGVGLALPDVRDAVARLKLPISAYGGVELAVTVAGTVEIRPWILSWGDGVEVLEPPELRDAVAASVAAAASVATGASVDDVSLRRVRCSGVRK